MIDQDKYPELAKMEGVQELSQGIGEFLDWLGENGMAICRADEHVGSRYLPVLDSAEQLLARHFQIDLKAAEAERRMVIQAASTPDRGAKGSTEAVPASRAVEQEDGGLTDAEVEQALITGRGLGEQFMAAADIRGARAVLAAERARRSSRDAGIDAAPVPMSQSARPSLADKHKAFVAFAQQRALRMARTTSPGKVNYADPGTQSAWEFWCGASSWAVAFTDGGAERGEGWEPKFDAICPDQERLAREFCDEIAGPRGLPGSPPDPVRLLEMAQALYLAEARSVDEVG